MPHGLLSVEQAAEHLQAGRVVAYPTEAVYGLGCDPADAAAVSRILTIKQRPPEAGLILIADYFDRLSEWVSEIDEDILRKALDTWPGPVTWLFPRSPATPDWLSGAHDTIAIRITAHPVCRALCAAFGGAIVSTSANPRGKPPAQSDSEVRAYFGDGIAGIVAGDLGDRTRPSEIRYLETGNVLRAS